MTEAQWRVCEDPLAMIEWLGPSASLRKFRLFGVASCYSTVLPPGTRVQSLDVVESYADGRVTIDDLRRFWLPDGSVNQFAWPERPYEWVVEFARLCNDPERSAESKYPRPVVLPPLLQEVFGNPFRPVAFDPRWRTSDTVGLARAIYDDRAFERLPILGDALMDAGCEDEQIISHCRSEGPHVRGCWVVDLVLGMG